MSLLGRPQVVESSAVAVPNRHIVNFSSAFVVTDSSGKTQITLDADLISIAALTGLGAVVRTASNTFATVPLYGSGATLCTFDATSGMPPATLYAPLDVVAGGSTPAENWTVVSYADASATYMDFKLRLSTTYAGGGITLHLFMGGGAAGTNAAYMGAAIRRITNDSEDIDTSHTYDYNYTSCAMPSTQGTFKDYTIAFTSGSDMDSLAAGEWFILRIYRDGAGAVGTDNFTAAAYLAGGYIAET